MYLIATSFPSWGLLLRQHSIFLIVGPSLIVIASILVLKAVSGKRKKWFLVVVPLLVLGVAISFDAYRTLYVGWTFRKLSPSLVSAITVRRITREGDTAGEQIATVQDPQVVSALLRDLESSKCYWREHEEFHNGYLLRFQIADNSFSASQILAWKAGDSGSRYILSLQTTSGTSGGLYESSAFVRRLMGEVSRLERDEHTDSEM